MTSRLTHWYQSTPTSQQEESSLADAESVRILILGDPGVGKTSLAYLLTHGTSPPQSRWSYERTIGCSTFVKSYLTSRECTSRPHSRWILEFLDVGGFSKAPPSRMAFYQKYHGIIFVFDVTNKKSFRHLQKWAHEIYSMAAPESTPSYSKPKHSMDLLRPSMSNLEADAMMASSSAPSPWTDGMSSATSTPSLYQPSLRTRILSTVNNGHVPILFVGNKTDVKSNIDTLHMQQEIAEQFSSTCVFMTTSFMSDGNQKLFDTFFDKVIDRKCSNDSHASLADLAQHSSQESMISDESGHRRRAASAWKETISPSVSYMWR